MLKLVDLPVDDPQVRRPDTALARRLLGWSPQRAIEVFPEGTEVANCWAPEIYYDARAKEYLTAALQADPGLGKGIGPVNHFHASHRG